MKWKYVIGAVVIAACVVLMFYFAKNLATPYVSIEEAMASGEHVQVIGKAVKDSKRIDTETGESSFILKDEAGKTFKVVTGKSLPTNFDHATQVVAKGRYNKEAGFFDASEILTKCPSKYKEKVEEETTKAPGAK